MESTPTVDTSRETTSATNDAAIGQRSDPALEIKSLSKRFGSGDDAVVAVDDVSLTVDAGAVVGLLGPNGAGKTTLIKCALGIVCQLGMACGFGVAMAVSGQR